MLAGAREIPKRKRADYVMTRDSWILGLAGVAFGILIGWIIGSQSARPSSPRRRRRAQQSAGAPQQGPAGQPQAARPGDRREGGAPSGVQAPPPLDEAQARALAERAAARPNDAEVRAQLGNLYFDAERYGDAIKWYEASLALAPKNANVSTDLAVSYYYTNQLDRALKQFETSLAMDPRHTKTLLNLGMVKAFGKQDLLGAAQAWKQVLDIAPPDSPEARAARQALESLRAAHPDPSGGDAQGGAAGRPKAVHDRLGSAFHPADGHHQGDLALPRWHHRWPLGRLVRALAGGQRSRRGARARGAGPARGTASVPLVRDPVCGTYVVRAKALTAGSGDQTQYFCSEKCRDEL